MSRKNFLPAAATVINRSKIAANKGYPTPPVRRPLNPDPIQYLLTDPTMPEFLVLSPLPNTPLPVAIADYTGGGQPLHSAAGQAASCAVTIGNSMSFVNAHVKKPLTRWADTPVLEVHPRAGEDLNAYYDRRALRFFWIKDPVANKVVFAAESAGAVAHELGHAILDILRPDFWDTPYFEVFAFHEAYGDCNAIMELMMHDQLLSRMVEETGGDFTKSSIITRLAVEMGRAASHLVPSGGYSADYLRNASNDFFYVNPETLPADTPDNVLSKEPHNFSRVWLGAWWEVLARIAMKFIGEGVGSIKALHDACVVASEYLLTAIVDVPLTARLFDAMARQMLVADSLRGGPHRAILLEVFNKRNILSDRVSILSSRTFADVSLSPGVRIHEYDDGSKSVYVKQDRTTKVVHHLGGVQAQAYNPLYELNISLPTDKAYHFDSDGVMIYAHEPDMAESLDAARSFLDYLNDKNLVSGDPKTPFEVRNDRLVRTHFACTTCQQNNACIKGAPEYQKGYKGNNNAGCGCKGCGNIPVCDCGETKAKEKVKIGCVTRVHAGSVAKYTTGYNTSRTVC